MCHFLNYSFLGSKERDIETGLDFFQARYFSSVQGRFTSPDEFAGGPEELYWFDREVGHNPTFYAELEEPQSLNKYVYCLNNPLRYVDPDGHQAMADALRLGAAVGAGLEAVPGGQAAGTGVLVVTGVAALGYAAYNTDWRAAWNGLVNSVARGFGGESDRPGAYIAEKYHPLKSKSVEPTEVTIDASKHPESAKHAQDAQNAGQPSVLTVDRGGAKGNRKESLKGQGKVKGKDRDEYPPAVTKQGGKGASVKPISPSDNRGAGASIGNQIKNVPDGGKIKIVVKPTPEPKVKP